MATKPAAIAFISLSCWKRRWSIATETAVMPSMTIARVISRTSGVASGLPAASARIGAPTKKSPYQARLKVMAMVRAVVSISSTRPRHWTVAAIRPASLTWMRNALAASATA